MIHIQCNCHCNQLYDGKSSWWLQGYIFLHIMSEMWVTFWFQRCSGSEGRKALQTFELMYEMFMQRVQFVISSDVIASTVEKDTENQMLLYFVICIVIEPIRVGHSGKACFPGRKSQWLTIFVASEYYTDIVKVCWPKNVSEYFISVSLCVLFCFFLGWGGVTQKCKTDIAFLLCNAWLLIM